MDKNTPVQPSGAILATVGWISVLLKVQSRYDGRGLLYGPWNHSPARSLKFEFQKFEFQSVLQSGQVGSTNSVSGSCVSKGWTRFQLWPNHRRWRRPSNSETIWHSSHRYDMQWRSPKKSSVEQMYRHGIIMKTPKTIILVGDVEVWRTRWGVVIYPSSSAGLRASPAKKFGGIMPEDAYV